METIGSRWASIRPKVFPIGKFANCLKMDSRWKFWFFIGNWLWFSTVQRLCRIVAVTWKLHIFCLCAINRIVYFLYKYFLFGRWWACSHYIWEWLVGKNMMLFREQGNTIGSCWSVGDNIVHWWGWGWGGKHWSTIYYI